ncbi:MobF family relaxase [Afipia sp. 1NLS2]|uniref:MobF family relaxase n=1 Tax=Afipia sp. 1NLS2 TaxID=666684 RepID=UPI0001DA14F7|nr:MobF family relaxase [Afipia sp. 1NLS2]EFI52801.1 TrwC relaxase [Afipia sp. 1NLS2]
MVATFAIIHRPAYYTSQPSAYYTADKEAAGVWLRGNERLGIVQGSAVRPRDFDLLCEGCDTTGKKLVKTPLFKRRVLGVDITLSSPKAVSVLYAAGDDALREEIASAERASVEATLRIIEQEIPLARRGKDGVRREHAKFVAAVFTHSEARPETHADGSVLASVQRHHHVCLPSIVERLSDSTFGALDTAGGIRSGKKLLGSIFRLQLATELEQRGFAIERADDGWRWSIAGVPDKVAKFFSARRSAIEAELAKAGLTSGEAPSAAAAITRKNRRTKDTVHAIDRIAGWQEAIKDLGFDSSAIVEAAREAGREAAATRDPATLNTLIRERTALLPASLTEFEATFERRHLLEAACNALVGTGVSVEQAVKEADALIQSRAIVELGTTRDGVVLSTPEMVAIERRLVETAVNLAQARLAVPDPGLVRRLCQENGLSREQTEVALAATSGARLVNVLAPAGTGKSKLLGVIARSFEVAGYSPAVSGSPAASDRAGTALPGASVVGASVAWRAALDLGQSINVPSSAIDALLNRLDSRVAEGKPLFEGRTVLLIDESGLQSSPQLARILDHISRDNSRSLLVVVGDERQVRPIGPGHAIRLVREAIGAATLSQIYRQREAWAREAPQAFARGDAEAALKAFDEHGLIEFHDGLKPTVDALADAWQQARLSRPSEQITVLTKSNAEARAVAAVLRNRLKREGIVGTREVLLPAVDASGNPHTLPVAAGDTLVALRRVDRIGVVNGTPLVVERVKVARLTKKVTITARRGDEIIQFTPEDIADGKGRVRLANGLVSTIFRAQGATVDQAFVLLNEKFDRHDSYVSASRARGDTRFFCSRSLDSSIRASSGDFHSEIDDAQRLDHLAQRLSRERVKTTTLDLIDVSEFAKAHIKRERNRQKELGHEF